MRTCRVCHQLTVTHRTGPATCQSCRREKSRQVKQRYRSSLKGQTTTRAYEQLGYVKERRRRASRSQQGRRNKVKYEATDKGKRTRQKAIVTYRASAKGRARNAWRHQQTKAMPHRKEQRRLALDRYRRTEKGKAWKHRGYVRRAGALRRTTTPLTSAEWLDILRAANRRCHYCHLAAKLTIDHVIPLSKGGTHTKANVVPACTPCNSRKSNRLSPHPTFGISGS